MKKMIIKTKQIISFMLASVCILGIVGCSVKGNSFEDNTQQVGADTTALEKAYIYTLPLAMIDATMEKSTNTVEATQNSAPVNQVFHLRQLANADSKLVVTPNVDTVYSQSYLDLSQEAAMILEKPFSDRYYMIQVMNAYSDTLAILGTGTDGQEKNTYLITRENYTGEIPSDVQHIKSNTDLVWIIIRIISNGEEDLPNIHALQDATQVMPLKNYISGEAYVPSKGTYDEAKNFVPVEHIMGMGAKEYFDNVNALMLENPPKEDDSEIMKVLETVNVGPGLTFDETILGEDLEKAWGEVKKNANAIATKKTVEFNTINGVWSYFDSPIGNFGTEYEYRAIVALNGLGANPIEAAIYAKTDKDTNGDALNGENTYKIHFAANELPPVEDYGFWSITIYGEDQFLIPNSDNIYAINDRTPFIKNEDGSLDLYISQELPDGVEKANWLPVVDDQFHLFLRIYRPTTDVINGTWKAPTVEPYN